MAAVGLIIVIILGGAFGGSIVGLAYIWVRACKGPRNTHPGLATCGRCNYPVRGAASMTCSECGADFREAGIYAPAMRARYIGPILFITLWSLCLVLPGCALSGLVVWAAPGHTVYHQDAEIEPKDQAASGYDWIALYRTPYGGYHYNYSWLWLQDYVYTGEDYLDIEIFGPNGNTWVEVDLNNSTYYNYNFGTSAPKPVDRAVVESWLGNSGADLQHPDVQKQADELYATIQNVQSNGLGTGASPQFNSTYHTNWTEQHTPAWMIYAQPVFWLLVYIAGIAGYFVLRRRYQRNADRLAAESRAEYTNTAAAGTPLNPNKNIKNIQLPP